MHTKVYSRDHSYNVGKGRVVLVHQYTRHDWAETDTVSCTISYDKRRSRPTLFYSIQMYKRYIQTPSKHSKLHSVVLGTEAFQ